jgi:hypothetical protein
MMRRSINASTVMNHQDAADLLRQYSEGKVSALDVRRRLEATYADILIALARHGLPLPQAPQKGREAELARARELMFPTAR